MPQYTILVSIVVGLALLLGVAISLQAAQTRSRERARLARALKHRAGQFAELFEKLPGSYRHPAIDQLLLIQALPAPDDLPRYDEALLAHQRAVAAIEHRAATGGHHLAGPLQAGGKRDVFAGAEAGLAFLVEDVGDVDAGKALDLGIAVDEFHLDLRAIGEHRQMEVAHSPTVVPLAHDVFWREFFGAQDRVVYGRQTPGEALRQAERVVQDALDRAADYDRFVRANVEWEGEGG